MKWCDEYQAWCEDVPGEDKLICGGDCDHCVMCYDMDLDF